MKENVSKDSEKIAIRLESGLVRPLTIPLNRIQSPIDSIGSEADKSAF